jgi:hypothetical protein
MALWAPEDWPVKELHCVDWDSCVASSEDKEKKTRKGKMGSAHQLFKEGKLSAFFFGI